MLKRSLPTGAPEDRILLVDRFHKLNEGIDEEIEDEEYEFLEVQTGIQKFALTVR
jgi:hypothetical protein